MAQQTIDVELRTELDELRAERDIRCVIHRCARGVDRRDWALVAACFHDDATQTIGSFGTGRAKDCLEWTREMLEDCVSSTHFVGNVLIEVDGNSAVAESYCLGLHRRARPDGTIDDAVANVRYLDRFSRRAGEWRIVDRTCVFDPGRVDPLAVDYPIAPGATVGRSCPDDASYGLL
jgi:hypothetical protein